MALPSSNRTETESDPLAEARRAARRAGMSLGEWLDAVMGESPDAADRGGASEARQDTETPARPASAPEALRAIARRLDRLGGSLQGNHSSAEAARATVGELEQQLETMAREMASPQEPAVEARQPERAAAPAPMAADPAPEPVRRSINGLKRAIDEIASRQTTLDREPVPAPETPSTNRMQDLESKIRALSGRLESHERMAAEMRAEPARTNGNGHRHNEARGNGREGFDGLRAEVREAAREFDYARRRETERLEAELQRLSQRIEALQTTPPDLKEWVEGFQTRLEKATNEELNSLRTEIREAQRFVEELFRTEFDALRNDFRELSDRVGKTGGTSPDLDARLEDLALRLDTATRSEVGSLREEIQEIARTVERSSRTDLEALQGEFSKLSGRLDAMGQRDPDLDARIDDLALRLDTATKREIGELREEIRGLTGQLDSGARTELSALKDEISKIADVLGLGVTAGNGAGESAMAGVQGLNAIRDEIRGLAERIDGDRSGYASLQEEVRSLNERMANQSPGRLDDMERRLNELADRLEANSSAIDMTALGQLEGEVTRLATLLSNQGGGQPADLGGVENAINELFERIEQDRATAVAAARDAAEEAVRRALESLGGMKADATISDALKEELVALRRHADASDERTQGTLGAVHDTLQKIVERLTRLENEVEGGGLPVPPIRDHDDGLSAGHRDDRAPEPVATREDAPRSDDQDEIVGRIARVTRAFKNEIDDNTPLAPGSGRPNAAAGADAGDDGHGAEDEAAGTSRSSDFIAAARRAAQTNPAEKRGARLVPDTEEEPAKGSKIGGFLKQYKRPLMIATAIVIIGVGAAQVLKFMSGGDVDLGMFSDETPAVASLPPAEPATSERQTAAPETAATADPAPAPATEETAPAQDPFAATDAAQAPFETDPIETGSIGNAATSPAPAAEAAAPATEPVAMPDESVGPQALRQAAADGDAAAQYEVAFRYTEGYGVDQDLEEASRWYRLAAAQGLAPAQYRLGSLYEKGEGVEKDLNLARMWYQRAAEQGNRKAMHNLAVLYADGLDGKPDFERAAIWFRQAAEYGLPDSQYNLAVLYARGMGTPQNLSESYKWFGIAANSGDGEAEARKADVASRLEPETVASLDAEIASFEPKPLIESANAVRTPPGGWGSAEGETDNATLNPATLIRFAQTKLNELGYNVGQVDGKIGPRTREAVREFQRAQAIEETGRVDIELVKHLQQAAG